MIRSMLRRFYIWLFGDPWVAITRMDRFIIEVTNRINSENWKLMELIQSQKRVISHYRKRIAREIKKGRNS